MGWQRLKRYIRRWVWFEKEPYFGELGSLLNDIFVLIVSMSQKYPITALSRILSLVSLCHSTTTPLQLSRISSLVPAPSGILTLEPLLPTHHCHHFSFSLQWPHRVSFEKRDVFFLAFLGAYSREAPIIVMTRGYLRYWLGNLLTLSRFEGTCNLFALYAPGVE